MVYLNIKEKDNRAFLFKLRKNGKIITLRKPFKASDL